CIVQVVMRYIFNESLTWSEELSRYAFVWFVYTSAAYAVRYQRHVKFSFLIHFSEKITPILSGLLKRSEEHTSELQSRFDLVCRLYALHSFPTRRSSDLCIVQVVMRYIFNESLTWSEELSRYAFVWFVYTSAAYAVRYQRHVKFSFLIHFSEKITPILSGLLKITALFFWISFLVFLDIYRIKLFMTQFNT